MYHRFVFNWLVVLFILMGNNDWWDRKFRRGIVFDGLVALHEKRFDEWVAEYGWRDEVYIPGETKYVADLKKYVDGCLDNGFRFFDPARNKKGFVRFFYEFEKE